MFCLPLGRIPETQDTLVSKVFSFPSQQLDQHHLCCSCVHLPAMGTVSTGNKAGGGRVTSAPYRALMVISIGADGDTEAQWPSITCHKPPSYKWQGGDGVWREPKASVTTQQLLSATTAVFWRTLSSCFLQASSSPREYFFNILSCFLGWAWPA